MVHNNRMNDSLFIMVKRVLAILGRNGGGGYKKRIILYFDLYPVEIVQHLHDFLKCILRLPLVEQTETGCIFVLIDHLDVIVV